jgi:hypothetical protein
MVTRKAMQHLGFLPAGEKGWSGIALVDSYCTNKCCRAVILEAPDSISHWTWSCHLLTVVAMFTRRMDQIASKSTI